MRLVRGNCNNPGKKMKVAWTKEIIVEVVRNRFWIYFEVEPTRFADWLEVCLRVSGVNDDSRFLA